MHALSRGLFLCLGLRSRRASGKSWLDGVGMAIGSLAPFCIAEARDEAEGLQLCVYQAAKNRWSEQTKAHSRGSSSYRFPCPVPKQTNEQTKIESNAVSIHIHLLRSPHPSAQLLSRGAQTPTTPDAGGHFARCAWGTSQWIIKRTLCALAPSLALRKATRIGGARTRQPYAGKPKRAAGLAGAASRRKQRRGLFWRWVRDCWARLSSIVQRIGF